MSNINHVDLDTFRQVEKETLRGMISSWFVNGEGNFLDFFGNGDMVRHLLKKVAPSRIHAVECNKQRAINFNKFPSINSYAGEVKDYADISLKAGTTFRAAWLDYCGPISPAVLADTAAVAPLISRGGMLILTLLAARERHLNICGHELREAEYPVHVLDAAGAAGYRFELKLKAFYAGKCKKSTMLVFGFKRVKLGNDPVPKAWIMPSVITAKEWNGLRVIGSFGK